ncbi:MAG TPA: cytochrome c peroxidase [bacterium]
MENPYLSARQRSIGIGIGVALLAWMAGENIGHAQTVPSAEAQARQWAADYIRPAQVMHPADNTPTPARTLLGKTLFFDPRLSDNQEMSCATCHNPAQMWQDGVPLPMGAVMKVMSRRTPPLLNLAWGGPYTWDGRAATLEGQALGPITSPAIMNLPADQMVERLRKIDGYALLFERAYPGEKITPKTVGKAIAVFERSLVSGTAPFDEWAAGNANAMSDSAKRGFVVFNTKGNCAGCHAGWRFTDDGFYDIGIPGNDRGRGKIVQTVKAMEFAFKTPTLRDVADRAPYMHNGSVPTLEAVVDHYNRGGAVARATLAPTVRKLNLTAVEKADLVAFLKALTGTVAPVDIPGLPQ